MLIIDMGMEIHKTVFGNEDKFKKDELGNVPNYDIFAFYLLSSILYKINLFGCSKENPVVIAVDSRKNWRKDYFESIKQKYFTNYGAKIDLDDYGYKINRKKDSKYDWNKIYEIANDVIDVLDKSTDVAVVRVERAEADDVIGVCAKYEANKGKQVYISSSDKDFRQLLINCKNIHLWHPITKSWIEEEDPVRFMQILYLTGDPGDDVPQTKPRMGPGTALKTIPNLPGLLAVDKDFRFRYETNLKLINFDFIPQDIQDDILKEYNKNHLQYSQMELLDFFSKYKIVQLIDRVNQFMLYDRREPTNLTRKFYKQEKTVNQKVLDSFLDELF